MEMSLEVLQTKKATEPTKTQYTRCEETGLKSSLATVCIYVVVTEQRVKGNKDPNKKQPPMSAYQDTLATVYR